MKSCLFHNIMYKIYSLLRLGNSYNVLTAMLHYLQVNYTDEYANHLYDEHPYKYNMYGLSMMLSTYKIENMGIRIEDKSQITELPLPFIAHVGNDFVTVYKVIGDKIYYIGDTDKGIKRLNNFNAKWTGNILLAQKTKKSEEPGFYINIKEDMPLYIKRTILFFLSTIVIPFFYFNNGLYKSLHYNCLLFLNIMGLYISYLLILKDLNIPNQYTDRICSWLKEGDCNSVLKSPASSFYGINWSEVGFSYFVSNLLILTAIPTLFFYYIVINFICLPYSLWSIWYQKKRIKKWCPLCLCVQVLLWIIFITNIYTTNIAWISSITFKDIYLVINCYLIPYLLLDTIIPLLKVKKELAYSRQDLINIKMKRNVFKSLLTNGIKYNTSIETSRILFGNTQSNTIITILINPYCMPCAEFHSRFEKVIIPIKEKICIQYVFVSFKEYEQAAYFLVSSYFNRRERSEIEIIYHNWFLNKRELYLQQTNCKESFIYTDDVIIECKRHEEWAEKNKLYSTPTVLINGYILPETYQIEDLLYVSLLDL